jgi:hypothetical protein
VPKSRTEASDESEVFGTISFFCLCDDCLVLLFSSPTSFVEDQTITILCVSLLHLSLYVIVFS